MSTFPVRLAAVVILIFASNARADRSPAPTFEQLRDLMRATVFDREPVEYRFSVESPTILIHGEFARRGEQRYGAAVLRGDRGSMASESSWDGKACYRHAALGRVDIDPARGGFSPGTSMPEDVLMYPVRNAYGVRETMPSDGDRYTFREVRMESDTIAIASFDFDSGKEVLLFEVWHDLSQAGWPIRTNLSLGGVMFSEVRDVVFFGAVKDGKWRAFPVSMTADAKANRHFYPQAIRVDLATLKQGDAVRTDFTIKPFPFEAVNDLRDRTTKEPADPMWLPEAPLRFPFTDLTHTVKKMRDRKPPTSRPARGA